MQTQLNIRRYDPEDLEAVVAIFRSNIPKYFGHDEEAGLREFLGDPRREDYFVCELDGDIIGAGGIALNEDETVSLRINAAREKHPMLPLVISTSQHTQGFYERFGFRLTHHEPDGFGPGIDICKMRFDTRS
jgi:hypothetical protein